MRPKERRRIYERIIENLWDGTTRVTHPAFLKRLAIWRKRLRKNRRKELPYPSQQTYSRIWIEFCQRQKLRREGHRGVMGMLIQGLSEGEWDPSAPDDEAIVKAARYLSQQGIIPPVPAELLRRIRTIRVRLRRREQKTRDKILTRALGTVLSEIPLAKRFRIAHELLRYPSAALGKVGIAKLEAEDIIRREIEETLMANGLSLKMLLSHPNLEEKFEFVDRRATSTLQRWEREEVIRALPFYLAARHQQAVDALIFTFVRMVRLLKLRVRMSYDEQVVDTNRVLFERRGEELKDLRRAVLAAMESGDPSVLKPFRSLLSVLEEQGEEMSTQRGYYLLLASRGMFARKIARRLKGVRFEGREPNACAVIEALQEVLRFAPFSEEVPNLLRKKMAFLDVSDSQLANRRIFETVVLITLADLIWLGRITSPDSRRFGNLWDCVVEAKGEKKKPEIANLVSKMRTDLKSEWDAFGKAPDLSSIVVQGRLATKRPPRKRLLEEEVLLQRAKQRFLSGLRPISIVDVVAEVHRWTGMLDAIQINGGRGRRLPDDQRTRLALAVITARGMNVGVPQMATLLGRWYTVGSLTNFDENYVTVESLERANGILLDVWEQRMLGRAWGTGRSVAADGRSIFASERNLQSGYHYRHRRSGVTLYWLVRDDWIASRVGVIGNHEWESWFLLDGLLSPCGGSAPNWAAGDTHGQHLALWGLSYLVGKAIRARFRRLSHVKLYNDGPVSALPVRGVMQIRWPIVELALPSLERLVGALRAGTVTARDILSRWNVYDEQGINITEALRELGKAVRTSFVLRYALSVELRQQVREACNRAETWNSFQEAVFWGHGGRMHTNDPRRREVNALSMQLLMNSIVFYNAEKHGQKLQKIVGSCPITWEHVRLLGDYRITSRRNFVAGSLNK